MTFEPRGMTFDRNLKCVGHVFAAVFFSSEMETLPSGLEVPALWTLAYSVSYQHQNYSHTYKNPFLHKVDIISSCQI